MRLTCGVTCGLTRSASAMVSASPGSSAAFPPGLRRAAGPGHRAERVSGKSTLLRVVAGMSRPSAGQVTGRPHCGYVPERFPGGLPFSGREYLLHLARVHGLRGRAAARAVEEWLDRLGAASYAGQPLRALSKGMCQKMALAQALLARPGLLVLDEAWTGLDQAARGELDAAVAERVADGGAVMFVDHEQARLAGLISERWRLDDSGQVTCRWRGRRGALRFRAGERRGSNERA